MPPGREADCRPSVEDLPMATLGFRRSDPECSYNTDCEETARINQVARGYGAERTVSSLAARSLFGGSIRITRMIPFADNRAKSANRCRAVSGLVRAKDGKRCKAGVSRQSSNRSNGSQTVIREQHQVRFLRPRIATNSAQT